MTYGGESIFVPRGACSRPDFGLGGLPPSGPISFWPLQAAILDFHGFVPSFPTV